MTDFFLQMSVIFIRVLFRVLFFNRFHILFEKGDVGVVPIGALNAMTHARVDNKLLGGGDIVIA